MTSKQSYTKPHEMHASIEGETFYIKYFKPSSDVMCFCCVELNCILVCSTAEKQLNSDVTPESNHIQDLLKHHNSSPPNSSWQLNLAKKH